MEIFKSTELNFSDRAIEHFIKSLDKRGNGIGIQIGVRKAGCSGYEYFFDFVDEIKLDHKVFEKNNCKIFVDEQSLSFLKGTLVDYSEDGLNKGIKFENPNAKAVCGCGESFTI
jgi:iron-sulfur cluster assembly protein